MITIQKIPDCPTSLEYPIMEIIDLFGTDFPPTEILPQLGALVPVTKPGAITILALGPNG